MSEIDNLLTELRNMKSAAKATLENNKATWKLISKGDLSGLGFTTEAELSAWIEANPYHNL